MHLIAHRGNISGKNPDKENDPIYVKSAIEQGYEVEVDIWFSYDSYFLGHDSPKYKIEKSYVYDIKDKCWFHCKNQEAMTKLNEDFENVNFFWHENDRYTITSKGYIWAYPGQEVINNSIFLFPENYPNKKNKIILSSGICSDYIAHYSVYKNIEKINHKKQDLLLKLKNPVYNFYKNKTRYFDSLAHEDGFIEIDPKSKVDQDKIYHDRILPAVTGFADKKDFYVEQKNVFIFPFNTRYYHNITELFPRLLELKKIDPNFTFIIASWIEPDWIFDMSTLSSPTNRDFYSKYLIEFLDLFEIKYQFLYAEDLKEMAFEYGYIFYEKGLMGYRDHFLTQHWHELLHIDGYRNAQMYFMVNQFCQTDALKSLSNNILFYLEKMQLKIADNSYPKKIFISRKNFFGRRGNELSGENYILKEKNLEKIFEENGYTVLAMEDYSFLEQIKLSYNAEIIACFIGSSIFNICYSNFKTKVFYLNPLNIEFNTETHLKAYYSLMLELLEAQSSSYDIDMFNINAVELKEVLSNL